MMSAIEKRKRCSRCNLASLRLDKLQCPSCGFWNVAPSASIGGDGTVLLRDARTEEMDRFVTGPWDECFGGHGTSKRGIVRTSVTLVGGAPGAGKSTMALQLSDAVAGFTQRETLLIAAEESAPQVKDRAIRLNLSHLGLIRVLPALSNDNVSFEGICEKYKPAALVLDSVAGLCDGDLNGAVDTARTLKRYSIKYQCPTIIIDHVTKEDDFAGLEALQHTVDTTMSLFPDEEDGDIRTLRTIKNRFGKAFVEVYFSMTEKGLVFVGNSEEENG